jgi:acyl-coenzyme A thioesterase PaaI-like protein
VDGGDSGDSGDSGAGTAVRPGPGPRVGQTASRSRMVTARDDELVAEMSGGRIAARPGPASAPPVTVVPGGVAVALLDAVLAEGVPGHRTEFLRLDLRFLAPVRPGDVITGEVGVSSVSAGEPIIGVHLRITRDDGVVVVAGTALCRTVAVEPAS